MQIQTQGCLVSHGLRALALGLIFMLGLDWSQPILVLAQPNGAQAGATVSADELPPMQEAQTVGERKPFYKKWWFWTIVAVVVGGTAAAVAATSGGGSSPPSGSVTVTGPPPR